MRLAVPSSYTQTAWIACICHLARQAIFIAHWARCELRMCRAVVRATLSPAPQTVYAVHFSWSSIFSRFIDYHLPQSSGIVRIRSSFRRSLSWRYWMRLRLNPNPKRELLEFNLPFVRWLVGWMLVPSISLNRLLRLHNNLIARLPQINGLIWVRTFKHLPCNTEKATDSHHIYFYRVQRLSVDRRRTHW